MEDILPFQREAFEIIKDKYDYDGMGWSNNKKPLIEIFKEIYEFCI